MTVKETQTRVYRLTSRHAGAFVKISQENVGALKNGTPPLTHLFADLRSLSGPSMKVVT